MSGFGGGLAGLGPNNSFHEPASWVDQNKPPGHTSTSPRTGQKGWWYAWPHHSYVPIGVLGLGLPFIYSPNLVWFAIAMAMYVLFPYDMEAAAVWDPSFVAQRAALNLVVGMGWYGYWHTSLYTWGWGKRKFNGKNEGPSKPRLFHNIWYCILGMLQWTAWELALVHMFATKKAPYMPDDELFASLENFLPTLCWVLALPVFRDFHFYFAHRLIHVRSLYVYVHSLHHRNSDPEPFSGMSMHPVEHIYYLSCAALSLYARASPFLVVWNLIHAVLAPAAGHSGYEDHWQSDQFHHIHHQYFECNYGNIGFPFDKWFGTIRHSIVDSSDYVGAAAPVAALGEGSEGTEATEAADAQRGGNASKGDETQLKSAAAKAQAKTKPSASLKYLRGSLISELTKSLTKPKLNSGVWPKSIDHAAYWTFTATLAPVLYGSVFQVGAVAEYSPSAVAAFISVGPVAFALLCGLAMRDSRSPRWPFHKEGVIGSFGWHLVMCTLIVVVPTFHTVEALLSPPCEGLVADLTPFCWSRATAR